MSAVCVKICICDAWVLALSLLIQWAPEQHLKRTCPASEANLKPLPLTRSSIPPRVQPPSSTPKASCVLDSDSTLTANPAGPKEGSGWPLHLPTWDRSHLEGRRGGLDSMKIKGMIRQPPKLSRIFLMCVLTGIGHMCLVCHCVCVCWGWRRGKCSGDENGRLGQAIGGVPGLREDSG